MSQFAGEGCSQLPVRSRWRPFELSAHQNFVRLQPQPATQPDSRNHFQKCPGVGRALGGTEAAARIKVTDGQLGWADVITVMEKRHKERLRQKFPEAFAAKPCICLFIPDDYEFMDAALVELLREKMREHFPAIG